MTTGFYTKRSATDIDWALAGDGVGRAAWFNVPTQAEANALAEVHGSFVELSPSRFDGLKAYYLDAAKVAGPAPVVNVPAPIVNVAAPVVNIPPAEVNAGEVSVSVDMQAVVDAIKALPAELIATIKGAL